MWCWPHGRAQPSTGRRRRQGGCGGLSAAALSCAATILPCLKPPPSGVEALTVVEWRMQLLLKSKHREKGRAINPTQKDITKGSSGGAASSSSTTSLSMSKPQSGSPSRQGSQPHSRAESPVRGAAAFHPDIVSAAAHCCQDPSSFHHHHHHLHHHHYHDHRNLMPSVEYGGPSRSSSQARRPTIKPSDGMDPRFTPTCPCGGLLMRASSLQRLYAKAASADNLQCREEPSSSSSLTPRSPFFKGKSRERDEAGRHGRKSNKEGKGKLKKHFDFSSFIGFFRPRKVEKKIFSLFN